MKKNKRYNNFFSFFIFSSLLISQAITKKKFFFNKLMIEYYLPCNYFINDSILGFSLGILFSYWSYGIYYYLVWILLYEFFYIYYLYCFNKPIYLFCRLIIILSTLLGWILGRFIIGISII